MMAPDPKATLIEVLQQARDAMVWKLDGLADYDVRRPLTPTGTNLLGLVKHLASVELGYFGDAFGRPHGIDLPWYAAGADPNADLWVTPEESRHDILGPTTGPGRTRRGPSRRTTSTARVGCRTSRPSARA